MATAERPWNGARFTTASPSGFYESYFQRANHPERPLAFWIRYTSFCPRGRPEEARGELWAIVFDGERSRITAVKETVPFARCRFSATGLDARIGDAALVDGALEGQAASNEHTVQWRLRYGLGQPPLLLLPRDYYARAIPKAKVLVGAPNATFDGEVTVDGKLIAIEGWIGSQNHNWGVQHTDRYAWGQVAGFDNAPDAFLECSTAQIRIGPVWSPRLTLIVLRLDGQELALNGPWQSMRARGAYRPFEWRLESRTPDIRIEGRIHAAPQSFVGLTYANPPGGTKTCLNTKVAAATFTVEQRGREPRTLTTAHRAAFEIVTDDTTHGVPIVA